MSWKSILDTKVFSCIGVRVAFPLVVPKAPLWSLSTIKAVAANIMYGAASILCSVPDILHVQHQFFGLFKGKNTFQKY